MSSMQTPSDASAVDHAITSRMSARAFTSQPVPRALITEILQVASRAPSGTNTQPWKVYVLQGASRDSLVDKVCAEHEALRANPELAKNYQEQYDYYPTQWVSPYIDRRRENGWSLYGLLGIGKADKDNHGSRLFAGLRHVFAKHHAGCACPWFTHLSAGRMECVSQHDLAAYRGW